MQTLENGSRVSWALMSQSNLEKMSTPMPPQWTINNLPGDSLDTQQKKNYFHNQRSTIVTFVGDMSKQFHTGKRMIGVNAPVKCGKKEIAQCMALFFSDCAVFYVTALNRKDVKKQHGELEAYHIDVGVINERSIGDVLASITNEIALGKKVIVIIDEDDYGAGNNQKMAGLWRHIVNNPKVFVVMTSASGEEGGHSATSGRPDYVRMTYTPPPEYRSASYFLDKNLVFEPGMAFEQSPDGTIHWTDHGREVVRSSITEQRHVGVFRVSKRDLTMGTFKIAKQLLLAELETFKPVNLRCDIRIIDDKDPFEWEG